MTTTGTPAGGDEVLQLWGVSRTFGAGPATVTALTEVTVGFQPGSLTAVMGPSGSGKSTLLSCAAGLDRPTSGRVVLGGTDLGELSETQLTVLRRERIGFVFQAFNLVSALTAAQNVALPLRLSGRRPSAVAVRAALAEVGLHHRADHRPAELSGGEQQRVAIARALARRPDIILADEPTGALDLRSSRQVLDLLRAAVDQHGQTVMVVTHDPMVAARADRVLFLADGAVGGDVAGPLDAGDIAVQMAKLES
jgi:putative ABC transport system ATP-binding protein